MWKQLRDASMAVGYVGGWCLKYVQDAFGTDHIYPTAIEAWNNEPNKHTDTPPLGITVPIYLSLGNVPAGHVAIRLDDGWVASSTQPGDHTTPYYHRSIDDLISVYGQYNGGATYLGWGEHVGSVQVVEYVSGATTDQVNQDYLDILERPADPDGLHTYTTNGMTNDQVRADLLASAEYQILQQRKAAEAAQSAPNPVTAPVHNPDTSIEPPVTPSEPVQESVTPEPTTTPSEPQTPVVEPAKAPQPPVKPQVTVTRTNIVKDIVNQLESNKTILLNVMVTFFQTSFAVWATTNFALDKLALTGAIGAGLSAVWNVVVKPALKAITK